MAHLYLDQRKNPPIWRYQFFDHTGKRVTATGTASKRETEILAQRREAHERGIRDGVTKAPKRALTFRAMADEYLAWGEAQGGHAGRPWSPKVLHNHGTYLTFWEKKLNLRTTADLHGVLPRVEAVLRQLHNNSTPSTGFVKGSGGRSGKTLKNYASSLRSFVRWMYTREYIDVDPLRAIGRFDITPKTRRRALTAEEIQKLLDGLDGTQYGELRRLGYEVALASGLRAGELRALRVHHLDVERGGLILDPEWTKNKNPDQIFQPLPRFLVDRLGEDSKGKRPHEPLVFVVRDAARTMRKDLERVGLSKWGPGGKVDFHALRVAYITFVIESGADIKTAQTLARHCSPQLTLNIYAKARPERLRATVEAIGCILPQSSKNDVTKMKKA